MRKQPFLSDKFDDRRQPTMTTDESALEKLRCLPAGGANAIDYVDYTWTAHLCIYTKITYMFKSKDIDGIIFKLWPEIDEKWYRKGCRTYLDYEMTIRICLSWALFRVISNMPVNPKTQKKLLLQLCPGETINALD